MYNKASHYFWNDQTLLHFPFLFSLFVSYWIFILLGFPFPLFLNYFININRFNPHKLWLNLLLQLCWLLLKGENLQRLLPLWIAWKTFMLNSVQRWQTNTTHQDFAVLPIYFCIRIWWCLFNIKHLWCITLVYHFYDYTRDKKTTIVVSM